jgi:hypothetical protein
MSKPKIHKPYCFAGQPALCPGYFDNDTLPCICDSKESLLEVLSQVARPSVPIVARAPEGDHAFALSA